MEVTKENLAVNQVWIIPTKPYLEGIKIFKIEGNEVYYTYFYTEKEFKKIKPDFNHSLYTSSINSWINVNKCVLYPIKTLENVSFKQLNR